jgi:hypothetical protein
MVMSEGEVTVPVTETPIKKSRLPAQEVLQFWIKMLLEPETSVLKAQ